MSDLSGRYAGLSHQELYNQLKAGDPEQVEGLASQWASMSSTLADLARSIETDLAALAASWQSSGGTEFQSRLKSVATFAATMSDEFHRVGEGLTLQAGPLRAAQQQAESPEETDDHDKALGGAAKGSVFGVAGVVVGGVVGMQQDKQEQEKAHNRMVQLVAGLANDYEGTHPQTWGVPIENPPANLPGSTIGAGVALAAIAGARAVSQISGTGVGGGIGTRRTSASRVAKEAPTHGAPQHHAGQVVAPGTTSDITPATGLAGAGNDTSPGGGATTGPGTGLAAGPGTGSGGGSGSGSGIGGGSGTGGGLSTGGSLALGVGLLAGGAAILGGRPATAGSTAGGGAGGGTNAMNSTGRPISGGAGSAGGGSGETARAASAKPGSGSATGAAGETARSASAGGRAGAAGNVDLGVRQGDAGRSNGAANSAAAGGRGAQSTDDSDERMTWLTEDEMVWQGDSQAAPPVLGG